jgi:hypothetical protein
MKAVVLPMGQSLKAWYAFLLQRVRTHVDG